ncbi:hypothetical protein [Sphingomonas sp. TZW2008]|uniref:hypothetical protein n=1 Tax=Sphingomonas sp. TZW2008 TaxID=1917973 RepID=UPI00211A7F87|nr:hypothetical protein [Sphingomonas sp. TZW2008]
MNRAILPLLLAGASALGGCTTLGGTVKGDFTCRAPAGTCAPMTRIDAAAIGQVAEQGADPAAGPERQLPRTGRGGSVAVRTGERMLSILLPAHVDEAGVLHDAATVRPASRLSSCPSPRTLPTRTLLLSSARAVSKSAT